MLYSYVLQVTLDFSFNMYCFFFKSSALCKCDPNPHLPMKFFALQVGCHCDTTSMFHCRNLKFGPRIKKNVKPYWRKMCSRFIFFFLCAPGLRWRGINHELKVDIGTKETRKKKQKKMPPVSKLKSQRKTRFLSCAKLFHTENSDKKAKEFLYKPPGGNVKTSWC